MVRAAVPPDVVAGRIDELHLEVVAPGLGPHPERNFVVLGELRRQLAGRRCIAGGVGEIEFEHQRIAFDALRRMHRCADAVRGERLPGGDVLHLVEVADLELRRLLGGHGRYTEKQEQVGRRTHAHPLTLPARMPAM